MVRCSLQQELNFTISYSNVDSVNHFLQQENIAIVDQTYGTDVTYTIFLDIEKIDDFQKKLTNFLSGNVSFKLGEQCFNETLLKNNNFHEQ